MMKLADNPSSNKVAAVLFDLDGTLLDSADDLGAALNHVLTLHNLPLVAEQDYRPVTSDGALGLLQLGFGQQLAQYDYDQLRASLLTYYQQNIALRSTLYQGVTELIDALDEANIPWGIITNKPEQLTAQLMPQFAEFNRCAVMLGGDSLPKRKPDPLPLLVACQQLAVEPSQCFYIGDAERDIMAGNLAKMTSFVALWGYIKHTDNVNDWQADHQLTKPTDLLRYIL
jgi:N-acetyl-D-muramate 6-phosphate phosphatase